MNWMSDFVMDEGCREVRGIGANGSWDFIESNFDY